MPTYLWVGSQLGATATTQEKIDQYCWNNRKNWRVYNGSPDGFVPSTSLVWGSVPGAGDYAIFGGLNEPSSTLISIVIPGSGDRVSTNPGWTHAKSPCLFGGYSGDVGLGTWSNTSGIGTGNTYSNGLAQFSFICGVTNPYADEYTPASRVNGGYPFPWLGGGITGDILTWCMNRDGLSAGAYVTANSSGFRNPQNPLTLKVHKDINIINKQLYKSSNYDSNGTPQLHTGYTKFIANIDFVKALQPTGGSTASAEGVTGPTVLTRLLADIKMGGGIRFQNLYAQEAYINSKFISNSANDRLALQTTLYENIVDYNITLTNPVIHRCDIMSVQTTKLVGGDVAYVKLYADSELHGFTAVGRYLGQEDFEGEGTYETSYGVKSGWSAPPTYLENGWDYYKTHWEIFGVTGGLADGIQAPYNGRLDVFCPVRPNVGLSYNLAYRLLDFMRITGTLVDPWNRGLEVCRETKRKIVLKPSTASPLYFRSPRFVNIDSVGENQNGSLYASFIPWSLEIGGSVSIEKMQLIGSYLHSSSDIPYDASININELSMGLVSTFEPYKYNQAFDKWYIGTINQSTGQVLGGIVFTDPSSRIWGDTYFRYWNTPTIAGTNLRQSELGYASTPSIPTAE